MGWAAPGMLLVWEISCWHTTTRLLGDADACRARGRVETGRVVGRCACVSKSVWHESGGGWELEWRGTYFLELQKKWAVSGQLY